MPRDDALAECRMRVTDAPARWAPGSWPRLLRYQCLVGPRRLVRRVAESLIRYLEDRRLPVRVQSGRRALHRVRPGHPTSHHRRRSPAAILTGTLTGIRSDLCEPRAARSSTISALTRSRTSSRSFGTTGTTEPVASGRINDWVLNHSHWRATSVFRLQRCSKVEYGIVVEDRLASILPEPEAEA